MRWQRTTQQRRQPLQQQGTSAQFWSACSQGGRLPLAECLDETVKDELHIGVRRLGSRIAHIYSQDIGNARPSVTCNTGQSISHFEKKLSSTTERSLVQVIPFVGCVAAEVALGFVRFGVLCWITEPISALRQPRVMP